MGSRLRIEALPAILEFAPVEDPAALVELLLVIADIVRRAR